MPKRDEKRNSSGVAGEPEVKNGLTTRRAAGSAKSTAAAAPKTAPDRNQMDSFQEAMRLFHARQFRQAGELFQAAKGGSDRAVAHRADLHARMCEGRLQSPGVDL